MQAVADGVFYAELNELLMRELGGEGYSGVEVRAPCARVCTTVARLTHYHAIGCCCCQITPLWQCQCKGSPGLFLMM